MARVAITRRSSSSSLVDGIAEPLITAKEQEWIQKAVLPKLQEARSTKKTVRVHATGHSHSYHSPLFDTDIAIASPVDLDPPQIDKTDEKDGRFWLTTPAATTLGQLKDVLAPHGLRLYGTPEALTISVGGAVVCGAHNGSHLFLPLAQYVTDMWLVNGQGQTERVRDPQLFVHYGLLGVVFRLRLEVFRAKPVQWTHIPVLTIEDAVRQLTRNTHSLKFGPYSGRIQLMNVAFVEDEAGVRRHRFRRKSWQALLAPPIGVKLTQLLIKDVPVLGKFASEYYLDEPDSIRDSFDYFEHIPRASVFTIEYALPVPQLAEAYHRLMAVIHDFHKQHHVYVLRFWARLQPRSNIRSLATYGRDTAFVEVTLSDTQPYAVDMVEQISNILLELGGRPHLGKTVLHPKQTRNYDFSRLKAAMGQFDPDRLFQNAFAQQMLQ